MSNDAQAQTRTPPPPSGRHDFYQNDVRVFISIYRKKVVEDELEIHAEANSASRRLGPPFSRGIERVAVLIVEVDM